MKNQVEEWAKRCKQGEYEAFAYIYDEFFQKIYTFIYYKTYHRENAQELTSQTFLKALSHIHDYKKSKGTFSAWIYRIARNVVIDHYRTLKGMMDIEDIWDLADDKNVAIDVENRNQWETVRGYLENLPGEQREIVMMRVWQDLSYREISEIVGKTEANCKMIFSRTITWLREEMSMVEFVFFFFLLRR